MNARTRRWFAAVEDHDRGKVRALLDDGVPVDLRRSDGRTGLMSAALANDAPMAALLLERGANLALEDHAGRNALDHLLGRVAIPVAAHPDDDFEGTATLLLAAGATPTRDSYRSLAMHHLPSDVAFFLRQSGGRGLTSRMVDHFRDEGRRWPHLVDVTHELWVENLALMGRHLGRARGGG